MQDTPKNKNLETKTSYTIEDAMKITDEIFKLNKDRNYNPGAFIHGLIFALELTQQSYNVSQQQIAQIKRSCRNYFNEIKEYNKNKKIKD